MVSISVSILSIAGALTLGAMSPGPSFVMVARISVASSRADGLTAALGMGIGGVLFAIAALLGLQVLLAAVPWLYLVIKLAGGTYLIYLGWKIWRGAKQPLAVADRVTVASPPNFKRAFMSGFATQISNPKTAVVYAGIFAALLPREMPLSLAFALPFVVFIIECGWYSIVAYVLSAASPREMYLRYKEWVDRVAGGVMVVLGAKLLSASREV